MFKVLELPFLMPRFVLSNLKVSAHFVPLSTFIEWLPGFFLGFDHSKELIDYGYKDAVRVLNQTKAAWF
jgi:hypothetical protein